MTLGEALRNAATRLQEAGIEAPMREARLLLGQATGIATATLLGWPERALPPDAIDPFVALIDRRCGHEPLSRIAGAREFWSLDFRVTPDTLDPRPDTETLIEAVLEILPDRATPLRLVDFGTGTGCILLALLSEYRAAHGIGVDRSEAAARVAAGNAASLGLAGRAAIAVGDWAAALTAGFDLAVSNPPYIVSSEIAGLDPEVRDHDPALALDGGADGFAAYRALIPAMAHILVPGGVATVELGAGQADTVAALMRAAGLNEIATRADLAGIPRVIVARKPRAGK